MMKNCNQSYTELRFDEKNDFQLSKILEKIGTIQPWTSVIIALTGLSMVELAPSPNKQPTKNSTCVNLLCGFSLKWELSKTWNIFASFCLVFRQYNSAAWKTLPFCDVAQGVLRRLITFLCESPYYQTMTCTVSHAMSKGETQCQTEQIALSKQRAAQEKWSQTNKVNTILV